MRIEPYSPLRVVAICGSPRERSRSQRLLDALITHLGDDTAPATRLELGRLPADDLLGRTRSNRIAAVIDSVMNADIVAVATPVYQASYSGLLKAFFDLLPRQALSGKVAVGIATGGTPAHQLVLEHGLRPLLASVGALVVPTLTYATDAEVAESIDDVVRCRLARAAGEAVMLARTPAPVGVRLTAV